MRHIVTALMLILALTSTAQRPKIGLVLGGGGAKGGAEVGVLKVLEEVGIHPDFIAGTSIGAIVGGLYAAGYSAAELEQLFSQQQWLSLLTDRRDDLSGEPYRMVGGMVYVFGFPVLDKNNISLGVLRGERVEQVIDSMLHRKGCRSFDELLTPFRCVAASMLDAREVVLHEGRLARAIRASMAIPGLFKPADVDGMKLVDGGMMNNLPVDVVRQMGADIIIAVDLQQNKPKDKVQNDNIVTGIADILGVGAIAKWVFTRPDITKYNANRKQCDIYINPPIPDYDASSFGNASMLHMIEIGEKSTRMQMGSLQKVAQQLLPPPEPQPDSLAD